MVVICWPAAAEIGVTQERIACAVQVHGAGAAQGRAAAELGAGHVEVVAQGPEDGRGGIGVDLHVAPVDVQCDHDCSRFGWVYCFYGVFVARLCALLLLLLLTA